jgi:RND family efflux transporter MFP subunit
MKLKSWIEWALAILVIVALGLGIARALNSRQTQKDELQAQQTAAKAQARIDIGPSDIVTVRQVDLDLTVPISGPIKATNSAFVKARVAGELQAFTLREGDAVKAGDVVARVDVTETQARLRQAEQQAQSAQAQVDIAKRSFDNNRSLVDQGFISKTALDASLASLSAAQANFRAAQAAADVLHKAKDDTVLRAPISGLVSQRLAQTGERVSVDARIVEIVDLSRMELEASLSAADSLQVRVGQSATLSLEGTSNKTAAKVVRINPSATTGSRAVLVYLSINPNPTLRQGLFAQGTLKTGAVRALALPLSTVRTDKPEPYVQWVRDNQIQHQTVTLGARGEWQGQPWVSVEGIPEGAQALSGTVGVVRAGTLVQHATQAK